MNCPRCGGFLVLRHVVTMHANEQEVVCLMCSRTFASRVEQNYRPMPEVTIHERKYRPRKTLEVFRGRRYPPRKRDSPFRGQDTAA